MKKFVNKSFNVNMYWFYMVIDIKSQNTADNQA
jgi:hypothetical protein